MEEKQSWMWLVSMADLKHREKTGLSRFPKNKVVFSRILPEAEGQSVPLKVSQRTGEYCRGRPGLKQVGGNQSEWPAGL